MKEPIPGMEDLTEEVPVEEASRPQKMVTPKMIKLQASRREKKKINQAAKK